MNAEKRENNDESAGSDIEGSGGNETATIPKKRGRPAKTDKVEKVSSGRGRGRPAKAGKPKVAQPISATGKGRGRPKAAAKRTAEDDDDDADADYEDRSPKKSAKSVGKRNPGRKRKAAPPSDDDDDDAYHDTADDVEDEVHDAVGRPASGAVNLNIQRTGRGQGRPKKAAADASKKSPGDVAPKKRGRPAGNKSAPNATRGRPKARGSSEEDDDSKDNDESNDSLKADESADENDDGEFITADKNPRETLAANQLAAA